MSACEEVEVTSPSISSCHPVFELKWNLFRAHGRLSACVCVLGWSWTLSSWQCWPQTAAMWWPAKTAVQGPLCPQRDTAPSSTPPRSPRNPQCPLSPRKHTPITQYDFKRVTCFAISDFQIFQRCFCLSRLILLQYGKKCLCNALTWLIPGNSDYCWTCEMCSILIFHSIDLQHCD